MLANDSILGHKTMADNGIADLTNINIYTLRNTKTISFKIVVNSGAVSRQLILTFMLIIAKVIAL